MVNKRKSILICSPYLKNIGGTEIEAILTAISFYDTNQYKKVVVFSPKESNSDFYKEIIGDRQIGFLSYPSFFNSKCIYFLNRIIKSLRIKTPFLELIYWFFISLMFTDFFVLTYPGSSYFFPLFQFYNKSKTYVAKITMWQFKLLSKSHQLIYNKFNRIIVFTEEQKIFWAKKNYLKQSTNLDIMILNEDNLLDISPRIFERDDLVFGYLGRISREKNIEEMIKLLLFLKTNNKRCKLIIQGNGDLSYLDELELLVENYSLSHCVEFRKEFINPFETHNFYKKIDVFLVTSKIEGGPMTALEAAASGCYVMGYDIGAMYERFKYFSYVVNKDFKSLCISSLIFLDLSKSEKELQLRKFRFFYKTKLSNEAKRLEINKLFN